VGTRAWDPAIAGHRWHVPRSVIISPVERHGIRIAALAWAAAWVVTAWLLASTSYESRDPDSQLYAGISARLVREPVEQWIAPQWWGFWNAQGPYCEHPVGMFVVPAVLGRLGYPSGQAAYAVNALYQIISFALVTLIASAVASQRDARVLGSILQLLPIAFVFRVRANQEYAVLAGVLFALYATERARTRTPWTLGMLAGFCGVLLVKGVFAVMVPIVCVLWLVSRSPANTHRFADRAAWAAIVLMPVVGAVVAWGYESAYVHVTGQSFLAIYRSRQLPEDAIAGRSPILRAAYTATWYATRVVWYAFPWSVLAGVFAAGSLRRGDWLPWRARASDGSGGAGRQGAWFALVAGITLTAAFSLAHRKADRYIFPVYFLIAAAGAGPALRRFSWLSGLAQRANRPWVPAALYVTLVLLTMLSSGKLPQFTFWRS
jgi:4-amino-4-deoxy-L-arabinose transferase-like glycosyltransferase